MRFRITSKEVIPQGDDTTKYFRVVHDSSGSAYSFFFLQKKIEARLFSL